MQQRCNINKKNVTWATSNSDLKMKQHSQLHPTSCIQGVTEELSDTLLAVGANGRSLTLLFCMFWQDQEETQSPKSQTAQRAAWLIARGKRPSGVLVEGSANI